ncbi:OmpA/MotB family protein [Desulfogranum mediterraneum]|uniref:OmpA/MotB family protein n=1 Tax=Desulfogranum mediterraneum TaxID=160661 RepID=UPI0004032519|nr:OmpA family protein [Desulfogranum mediterraneum]
MDTNKAASGERQAAPGQEDHGDPNGIARPPADYHQTISQPLFVIEDSFFRSRTPAATHWSIAWSDLMMTMFILFLTLFVYQLAHRQFLDQEEIAVIAGTTMPLPPATISGRPFHPISPQISQRRSTPLKAVEQMSAEELAADPALEGKDIPIRLSDEAPPAELPPPTAPPAAETAAESGHQQAGSRVQSRALVIRQSREEILEPTPLETGEPAAAAPAEGEIFTEIYDLSRTTLSREHLERFASVELIPDKTVRLILTGDLLFATAEAELTPQARISLAKLSPIIAQTPYMINVVGHTDSMPMHSARYPTNWELSVARASRVARFLVEEIGVPGQQIVVSGFSYFRPRRPNSTEQERRANRRVEIILSKDPAPAAASAPIDLKE